MIRPKTSDQSLFLIFVTSLAHEIMPSEGKDYAGTSKTPFVIINKHETNYNT